MIGFKTGKLTVIELSHKDKQTYWKAKCECGNIRIISTGELNRNRSSIKSCGCYRPTYDLTGQTFHNLTVIGKDESKKYAFLCKCSCGIERSIAGDSLKRNLTKSCGCIQKVGSVLHINNLRNKLLKNIEISQSGCWEWKGKFRDNGYGVFTVFKKKIQSCHRASWLIHNGEIPKGLYVCHKCDNKKCCNPDHLYLGTALQNTKDAIERGLFPNGPNKKKGKVGSKNIKAKLNENDVLDIKKLIVNNEKTRDIAERYNVSKSTILSIRKGKTWTHL